MGSRRVHIYLYIYIYIYIYCIPVHHTVYLIGADVNCASNKALLTPLMRAALNGKDDMVDFLLDHGAEIDAVNTNQDTALHLAVARMQPTTVGALLKVTYSSS